MLSQIFLNFLFLSDFHDHRKDILNILDTLLRQPCIQLKTKKVLLQLHPKFKLWFACLLLAGMVSDRVESYIVFECRRSTVIVSRQFVTTMPGV